MSLAAVLGLALVSACEGDPPTEDCCDGMDNDGDQLVDRDDMDCIMATCPEPDGGGDGDADTDSDSDADADTDSDPIECERDCSGQVLRTRCEVGDCTVSGNDTECCVAEETTCRTVLSVGDLYEDLEIDYRGFYSEEHQCEMEIMESLGVMNMVFVVQTRGLACAYGFIRVQLRAHVDEITVGETYRLCDDPALPSMRLVVTTNSDTGGSGAQSNFHNNGCLDSGYFEVTELGDESGEGYAIRFAGTLTGRDSSSRATGERLDIVLESSGRIEVEYEDG